MHRFSAPRFLLLALALAIGQWLSLAHTFEHPALKVDLACQICAHGQGLDGSALAPTLQLSSQFAISEAPAQETAAVVLVVPRTLHRIRGPPASAISPV